MPKVAVFATLTAQPGRRDELVEALGALCEAADDEPGTEFYAMHVSDQEPDVVRFYEVYTDAEAAKAHAASDAMASLGPGLAGLLAEPPTISSMRPVRAKGETIS